MTAPKRIWVNWSESDGLVRMYAYGSLDRAMRENQHMPNPLEWTTTEYHLVHPKREPRRPEDILYYVVKRTGAYHYAGSTANYWVTKRFAARFEKRELAEERAKEDRACNGGVRVVPVYRKAKP